MSLKRDKQKSRQLFSCGAATSQVAITPQGELKICLMIDKPRYKILTSGLRNAWHKLRRFSARIKVDKNYHCHDCLLVDFCKCCPAHSWLYNRTFTSCVPEIKARAERLKRMTTKTLRQ